MERHGKSTIVILALLLIVVIVTNTAIGSSDISPLDTGKIILNAIIEKLMIDGQISIDKIWTDSASTIILDIRLPRVLLGALVGAGLATAGAAMQGLLKNPMADPYIIGMSAGAALGAAIAFTFMMPVQLISFILAAASIYVVYNISRMGERVPTETLLLAGIAVGFFLSAITSFIVFLSQSPHQIIYWMMGGLWTASWAKVKITFVMILIGVFMLYRQSWNLNVMLLGEEQAQCMGVDIERVKQWVLIFSSLVTAAAVSVSGIIGFVGLIIPHIMRIIVGPDHRILLPTSTLMGAIFLVFSDTIARTILDSTDLPVGVVTAFFGAPFFIYLLRKRRQSLNA
ncbi:MAG: iron chelate uptake ABC transporter family permease subunit [Euryarchaeota archaeon]|nr:iron chelate uptake ABC transporter family permease subunit [Euryarchaeota archaeon]